MLDSLLKAFDERERKAAERGSGRSEPAASASRPGAANPPPAERPPRARESVSRPHEPAKRGKTIFTKSSTTASDIEALIKVAIETTEPDEEEFSTDPESFDPETAGEETPELTVDEGEIDESLFEELSEAAAEATDDPTDAELDAPLIVSEVTAKNLAESADEALVPVADDAERGDSDDWLTELKPEQALASESETLPDGTPSAPEQAPDTLTSPEMEEVLAAVPPTSEPGAAASFDDLFGEEHPGSGDDAVVATASSPVEPIIADAEGESLSDTTVIEEIGSENVAAGAAGDAPAKPAHAPMPKPASPEPAPPAAATEQPQKHRVWLPPPPLEILRTHPRRAAAAIAAGLLVGGGAFAYLTANRFRSPEGTLAENTPIPLERAMRLSASMMEERDYAGALRVLDAALRAAPPTEAHYADAQFQRVELRVATMPPELTPEEADALHSDIDAAVLDGRQHPRTAEALMWKAQVYERENNLVAARAEYRGILEDFGNALNRDEVLLRLGQLELKLDRPYESIAIARQLMADYPNSTHVNDARLLLGDASAAAGDSDGARVAYIRLAEDAMDSPVGAEAFERLGKLAIDSGRPDTAIEELQSRLQSATTVEGNERVYLILARAYRASKQPEEARKILGELLDFFPESEVTPLALVEMSQVLVDLGQNSEAVRFAERSVERYPKHPDVLVNAAALFARTGEHERAGRAMLEAFDAGAKRPAIVVAAGRELALAGVPRDAQAAFERVILDYPTAPETIDAHIGWARAALDLGDVNAAYSRLDQIAKTTEGMPRQLPVLTALAELYADLGLQQDAIATYSKLATVTDDPALLSLASLNLIEAGAADDGLAIARRVDVARLAPAQAYPFLQEWGRAMLRADVDDALEILLRAHDDYPDQRTAEGVGVLMKAVLARGRTAQARAILAEMQARTADRRYAGERPWFVQAAADYGDFLYSRGDYAAAAEAFAMASAKPRTDTGEQQVTDTEYWNAYQRANALFALGRVEESLALYDLVAASGASVARDARVRGDAARLEQRRRGGPAVAEAGV